MTNDALGAQFFGRDFHHFAVAPDVDWAPGANVVLDDFFHSFRERHFRKEYPQTAQIKWIRGSLAPKQKGGQLPRRPSPERHTPGGAYFEFKIQDYSEFQNRIGPGGLNFLVRDGNGSDLCVGRPRSGLQELVRIDAHLAQDGAKCSFGHIATVMRKRDFAA